MLGQTPQLQRYMTALNRIYHLPQRGFMTQGSGTLMGEGTLVFTISWMVPWS